MTSSGPQRTSSSSDEDIDPELREGINNIMKLHDEYNKLEGALRKLGVDPETVVNADHHADDDEAFGDDDDDDDEDEARRRRARDASAGSGHGGSGAKEVSRGAILTQDCINLDDLDPLSLQNRTDRLRRHLDILEEVDESILSSDAGGDDSALPPPPPPSYPWVQMALPGGGIVSVPLTDTTSLGPGVGVPPSAGSLRVASPDSAPGALQQSAVAAAGGSLSLPQTGEDLLTVPAGEPVTHFNLDQLLEIVQSFQLDTTLAGSDENAVQQQLNLALANESPIIKGSRECSSESSKGGCDGKLPCDSILKVSGASGSSAIGAAAPISSTPRATDLLGDSEQAATNSDAQLRETHSCPSSPTETDCSSGFSTLRRRSVTLTEKVRTNKDGSKTQVVRQYGCNTSTGKDEDPSNVTFQQNSFVLINGDKMVDSPPITDCLVSAATAVTSQSFSTLMPITATSPSCTSSLNMGFGQALTSTGSGLGTLSSHFATPSHATLPRVSTSSSSATHLLESSALGTVGSSSARNQGLSNSCSSFRSHIVRLNSIEPRTVMFNTKDYPIISDITVPEIIDELEKQFEDKLCDLQGVRLVASNVYICLSRKESLQHLTTYGFYARGVHIKVVDITNDSVVVCLTGVPHYISDAAITALVSTFGIAIGEVERRFYKGVDTGERFVRLKPRAHTQVPDFVTVGGCKILIRVLNQDEVLQPFTLQSAESASGGTAGGAVSVSSAGSASLSALAANGSGSFGLGASGTSKARVKPGHCNGNVNNASSPVASETCSLLPSFSTPLTSACRTEIISPGVTGLLASPLVSSGTAGLEERERKERLEREKESKERERQNRSSAAGKDSTTSGGDNASTSSLPASPKIAKSLKSRLSAGFMKTSSSSRSEREKAASSANNNHEDRGGNTYVAADPLDFPTLSPPPYKAPGSSGGSTSSVGASNGTNLLGQSSSTLMRTSNGDSKTHRQQQSRESTNSGFSSAGLLKKYHSYGNSKLDGSCSGSGMPAKTDSSNSLGSSLAGKSTEALRDGSNNLGLKRSSVNFDDDADGVEKGGLGKKDGKLSARNQATNKAVNGILRKGSGPGEDIVPEPSRRTRKSKEHGRHKSKSRSTKLESVTESGAEAERDDKDGDADPQQQQQQQPQQQHNNKKSSKDKDNNKSSSRSRSSSTKSSKDKAKEEKEKAQKDLALTRDLPWCGCWGNGCL